MSRPRNVALWFGPAGSTLYFSVYLD